MKKLIGNNRKSDRLFLLLALALLSAVLLGSLSTQVEPVAAQEGYPTVVYMFWGEGCPHCAVAKPFFEEMTQKYPEVEFIGYEIYYDEENQQKFAKMGQAFGFEARYVPTIFIGDQYWEGFSESMEPMFEEYIQNCIATGCKDAGAGVIVPQSETPVVQPTSQPSNPEDQVTPPRDASITIPLIGEINLANHSMTFATALIAFVDGVNPCSVWVLTMLLALTLHTGSRKRIMLIGLIFISITAAVYALFIGGLFTFLTFVSFMTWIQVLVAVVALVFALVNIKDYFWYKEGVSFTIADDKKPGIFSRMRRLLDTSQNLWAVIGATIVLAAGVSLVEFSCTAGFPVLWTNMLTTQGITGMEFVFLLVLYMVIYQIDELVIFFTAVLTLRATRLEEKHGRILKLIGGILMLTLASVMIINPSLLSELSSALIVFGIAFAATALVLILHRRVLPAFGIWIGTEKGKKGKKRQRRSARS